MYLNICKAKSEVLSFIEMEQRLLAFTTALSMWHILHLQLLLA